MGIDVQTGSGLMNNSYDYFCYLHNTIRRHTMPLEVGGSRLDTIKDFVTVGPRAGVALGLLIVTGRDFLTLALRVLLDWLLQSRALRRLHVV